MIYIFEDDKLDLIQQLFRASYKSEITDKFIYAKGIGNIKSKIEECLTNTTLQIWRVVQPQNQVKSHVCIINNFFGETL